MVGDTNKHPEEYGYRFVGCAPVLKKAEETNALARRYFETRDPVIRGELIVRGRGLVGFVQSEYTIPPHLQRSDLIGEGYIGFIKAVDSYNGSSSFVSWAIQKVRSAMSNYRRRNFKLIRPSDQGAKEVFAQRHAGIETSDPLLDRTREVLSLEFLPYEESNHGRTADQGGLLEDDERRRKIIEIVREGVINAELTERERQIIESRFPPIDEEKPTLAQLGRQMGLSTERVRQLQNKAFEKIGDLLRPYGDNLGF